jgi:hypothetical protein
MIADCGCDLIQQAVKTTVVLPQIGPRTLGVRQPLTQSVFDLLMGRTMPLGRRIHLKNFLAEPVSHSLMLEPLYEPLPDKALEIVRDIDRRMDGNSTSLEA